ncbi:MAG TPA: hypothetical protein VF209_01500 [Patescibacteria group bacterium]
MNDEKHPQRAEIDTENLANLLIKLVIFAGYTGIVYLAADKLNFLGDGLVATDLLTLGMELGGAFIIASIDDIVK